jgi:sugar phosphate isomerase/epimerase
VHINQTTRRQFIQKVTIAAVGATTLLGDLGRAAPGETKKRKITIDLACGNIGVSADQREAIELAARHGFESVAVDSGFIASLSDEQLSELKLSMKSKGLVFGAAGLPVEFRQDQLRFEESLKRLPKVATGLERAGVDRICTWLSPCDAKLTYIQNFRQHASRLREVAKILKDHQVLLGLEYVGPKTSWSSRRFPFIHTMAEMKDLISDMNAGNVGFVLDSWHWWHAGESATDIQSLKGTDVIAVDLNDAPAGIPKEEQVDSRRELPCATGVIDVGAFLNALNQIGYDGPVRAEPFNPALRKMSKDDACEAAASSLRKAFAGMESRL